MAWKKVKFNRNEIIPVGYVLCGTSEPDAEAYLSGHGDDTLRSWMTKYPQRVGDNIAYWTLVEVKEPVLNEFGEVSP